MVGTVLAARLLWPEGKKSTAGLLAFLFGIPLFIFSLIPGPAAVLGAPGVELTVLALGIFLAILLEVTKLRTAYVGIIFFLLYPIAAVYEIGMSEFDSTFVYMPLPEAQSYFNRSDDVSAIEIFLVNPDRIDETKLAIQKSTERPIFLTDWRQRNKTFFGVLEVERNVMFLILTLIVLVAALNIVSGLIMLVKDKSADIAILRTMGATRSSILRVFLITGASIGIVGTLAGFGLGLIVAMNIETIRAFLSAVTKTNLFPAEFYFLSHLPADVDAREVITVVGMALLLSLIATLYPAWRAARLDPVEALRYE